MFKNACGARRNANARPTADPKRCATTTAKKNALANNSCAADGPPAYCT